MKLKTRIAPTPSGFLHIGNAFSFLLTWVIARKEKGSILLRIDDLDTNRFREAYLEDIFRSLEWLGIDIDEGPSGPEDFHRNFSQRHRLPLYTKALEELKQQPETLFGCQLSRSQIKSIIKLMSEEGQYPISGREQKVSLESPNTALRIRTPKDQLVHFEDVKKGPLQINLFEEMRDFVVRKKDGVPAYQLASLVDDDHFGINYVVRGEDLLTSTGAQFFLAKKLGMESFLNTRFYHHPLIKNDQNQKLSKSEGATSLKTIREAGESPVGVYRMVGNYLGIGELSSLDELL